MLKRLFFYSAIIVLVSWSAATSSHAEFSINLPGFGLSLPLPGAAVNIGLPFVSSHVYPSYHEAPRYAPHDYGRHDRHDSYYGDRDSYRRGYGNDGHYRGQGGFSEGGHTGFYGGRY